MRVGLPIRKHGGISSRGEHSPAKQMNDNCHSHLKGKRLSESNDDLEMGASGVSGIEGLDDGDSEMLAEFAKEFVWGGFETKDQIVDILTKDMDYPADTVRKIVEVEWAAKLEAERSWPEQTDVDRLHAAFEALEEKKIIALHNADWSQSAAQATAGEEWIRRGERKSGFIGSAHYHEQDVAGVLQEGHMFIGFDGYPRLNNTSSLEVRVSEVAMIIAKTLEEHGFEVDWDGSINTRIGIKIDWKKRAIFESRQRPADPAISDDGDTPDVVFASPEDIARMLGLDDPPKPTLN